MGVSLNNGMHFDNHIPLGEYFVSERVSQIVEAIREYEPNIEVCWIPPAARAIPGERVLPAFKLVYHEPGKPDFILFHVEDESQFDERVLQRIIVNDQRNGTTTWDEYSSWEETQRLVERQKYLDKIEAAADIAAHVLKSPLNDYKVNKNLRIKDGIPFNAAKLKD